VTVREAIAAVTGGRSLTEMEAAAVLDEIVSGGATAAQIGALLVGLRMKGESVDELCGAARALRRHVTPIHPPPGLRVVDTCGTGGDAQGTFNVSTTAALIAAGAGVVIAKHGNRAVSGRVGGADVLEALGVRLDLAPAAVERCLAEVGIAFLFAPLLHGAMRSVAAVRRELGLRTIFNLVGPLANPAGVRHQVVGVFAREWVRPMAEALARLGAAHALVVHGRDGLDEITLTDATDAAEVRDGAVRELVIIPEELGLPRCRPADLRVGDAAEAAAAIRAVLEGTRGPRRDVAVANAAAALWVGGRVGTLAGGVAPAAEAIDAGRARAMLDRLAEWSRAHATPRPAESGSA
jgi:anthranilate phosphoribosyltransferase